MIAIINLCFSNEAYEKKNSVEIFLTHKIQLNCFLLSLPQASIEKMCRLCEDQLNEAKAKIDEMQRQLMDVTSQKARAQTECGMQSAHH